MRFLTTLLLLSLVASAATASDLPYDGQTITIATSTPEVAQLLKNRAIDFRNETGANVVVILRDYSSFFQDVLTDLEQGSPFFDVFVYPPQGIVDLVNCKTCAERPDLLEPLTDYVRKDPQIEWLDVAAFFRQFSAVYDGQIYSIPLDGDLHYLHVRKDILDAHNLPIPETWEEYFSVAQQLHGLDLNNDSVPDFGSCIGRGKGYQAFWWPWTVYGPYIQSRGTADGAFFDLNTMQPLVKNEGFAKAMTIYKNLMAVGPSNELSLGVSETRELFSQGRCAMTLDWANPFGFMKDTPYRDGYAISITPGTYEIVDRSTGLLVDCTIDLCPHATVGHHGRLVNRAPYAASGGFSGSVSIKIPQLKKELGYAYLSFMSKPSTSKIDVTTGMGFDPYRASHLNSQTWIEAGFPSHYLTSLPNFRTVFDSPNLIIDLRIAGVAKYQQEALDTHAYEYLSGNSSVQQFADRLYSSWEALTDLRGRPDQLAAYRATIGAPKVITCTIDHYNYTIVSDCSAENSIMVAYTWNEPKVCQGGVVLPEQFRAGQCTYIQVDSAAGIALMVTSGVIIAAFAVVAILIAVRRHVGSIRKSSWLFSIVIVFGGAIMVTFVFASMGEPGTGSCVVNIWLLSIGYVLLFGGFLTKMYRIDRLLNTPLTKKKFAIKDPLLAKILVAMVVVDVALLCVWTWLPPGPTGTLVSTVYGPGIIGTQPTCSGGHIVGVVLLYAYKAIMLAYGGVLSFRTRNAPGEFSEQRFSTTAIIVVGFAAVVLIPLIYTIESNKVLIACLGVLFATLISVSVYVIPKLLEAYGFARFDSTQGSSSAARASGSAGLRSGSHGSHNSRIEMSSYSKSSHHEKITCPKCKHEFEP